MNWKQTHSIRSAWILAGLLCLNSFGYNVTNTVVTVDQNGQLNVEGIASVQDVATNAAKAAVAEQKAVIAYQARASMQTPATAWQIESTFWAGIHLSATIPIRAGMKMDTKPCVAKKSQICGPKPLLARKLPIEVR